VLDDTFCPVIPEIGDILSGAIEALRKQGFHLEEGWPSAVKPGDIFETYLRLLGASYSTFMTEKLIEVMRTLFDTPYGYYYKTFVAGITSSHKEHVVFSMMRLMAHAVWQEYFRTFDAFVMPANFVNAFVHNHDPNYYGRTVETPGGPRFYGELFKWISIATLTGCPATAVPIGLTKDNLPVGMQIMGPFLEDATTIDLAIKCEEVLGGFQPPPGYVD
jgi:amidase